MSTVISFTPPNAFPWVKELKQFIRHGLSGSTAGLYYQLHRHNSNHCNVLIHVVFCEQEMNNDLMQRTFKNASLLTKSECSRRCINVSFSLAFSLSNNLKTTQRKNCRILPLEFTVLLLPIFFICGAGVISTLVT